MKQYIVDAFTNEPFSGNPAAVCVMERWPSEDAMERAFGGRILISGEAVLTAVSEIVADL